MIKEAGSERPCIPYAHASCSQHDAASVRRGVSVSNERPARPARTGRAAGPRSRSAPRVTPLVTPAAPDCPRYKDPRRDSQIHSKLIGGRRTVRDPGAATTAPRDRIHVPAPLNTGRAVHHARHATSRARHSRASPVSRHPGHGARKDDPQASQEAEAAAATTAIAGLRCRFRRQSTLEHPAVRRELRRLEEQLTAQLEQADHKPGRHRSTAGRTPNRPEPGQGEDEEEPGRRPGPATARTAAELRPDAEAAPRATHTCGSFCAR
jgi:hypothetical protein